MPTVCPECQTPLTIKAGEKEEVLKLFCSNPQCQGTLLKKLQKGISILEINGLGPKTIEKLSLAGIESAIDLFNPQQFEKQRLCASDQFKPGRSLEKIILAVKNVTEIPIQKFIQALQIMVPKREGEGYISIGKSLSAEIGKMISGVPYDFEGLSLQIREEIKNPETWYYQEIIQGIAQMEQFGIQIKKYEIRKPKATKKISKTVAFEGESDIGFTKNELLDQLNWEEQPLSSGKCNLLVTTDKNGPLAQEAQQQGIKVLTYKQIKLLFL